MSPLVSERLDHIFLTLEFLYLGVPKWGLKSRAIPSPSLPSAKAEKGFDPELASSTWGCQQLTLSGARDHFSAVPWTLLTVVPTLTHAKCGTGC